MALPVDSSASSIPRNFGSSESANLQPQKATNIWSKIWDNRCTAATVGGIFCIARGFVKREAQVLCLGILLIAYAIFNSRDKKELAVIQKEIPIKNRLLDDFEKDLPKDKITDYEEALKIYDLWTTRYTELKKSLSLKNDWEPNHGVHVCKLQVERTKKTLENLSKAFEKLESTDDSKEKQNLELDIADDKASICNQVTNYITNIRKAITNIRDVYEKKLKQAHR